MEAVKMFNCILKSTFFSLEAFILRKLTSDAVRNILQGKFLSSPSYHETLLATTDPHSVATENHKK